MIHDLIKAFLVAFAAADDDSRTTASSVPVKVGLPTKVADAVDLQSSGRSIRCREKNTGRI